MISCTYIANGGQFHTMKCGISYIAWQIHFHAQLYNEQKVILGNDRASNYSTRYYYAESIKFTSQSSKLRQQNILPGKEGGDGASNSLNYYYISGGSYFRPHLSMLCQQYASFPYLARIYHSCKLDGAF